MLEIQAHCIVPVDVLARVKEMGQGIKPSAMSCFIGDVIVQDTLEITIIDMD